MIAVAFVGLAAVGAVARWRLSHFNRIEWPIGTMLVNVTAAFALGLFHDSSPDTLTLMGGALLGSYSTFSTVVLEVTSVSEAGSFRRGAEYLGLTVVLGIGAALIGVELAR